MHVIRLLLLLTTAKAAKVAPLPTGAKRFLVVGQPRAGSTWLTKYSPLLARCPGVVTTGEALHPLTVERLAPQLLGNEASAPVWKSTSVTGARHRRPGSVERRGTGIATPSSRRCVDGVEDDAMIQHERAVKF